MPARWAIASLLALLALHAALGLWCARQTSVTYDEFAHLPAGVAYWRHGALPLYDLSPPLPRYWAALPAAIDRGVVAPDPADALRADVGSRHWDYGLSFMLANSADYHRAFLGGRAMSTLLSCAGLLVAFAWSRRLAGDAAGVAAAALWATCPNLLAHGSLVGTDSPAAVALLVVGWRLDAYLRRPTRGRGIALVIALAFAPMVKFSLLPAWPLAAIALAAAAVLRRLSPARALAPLAWLPFAAFAACWLCYAGQPGGRSLAELGAVASPAMAWLDAHGFGGMARLFPAPLVEGFDYQLFDAGGRFEVFFFGRVYRDLPSDYYPIVLACKWTSGLWLLVVLAAWASARARARTAAVPAWLALGYAVAFAMLTQINGSRYMLPALPLAIVAAAAGAWGGGGPGLRRVAAVAVAIGAIEGLPAMRNPLGFYNVPARLAGVAGREFIDEDWGQSLIALRGWMRDRGVARVRLAYVGCVDPTVYGIDFDEIDDPSSTAEWIVCSATFANGVPTVVAHPGGGVRRIVPSPAIARRMREGRADARVGAFYLFRK